MNPPRVLIYTVALDPPGLAAHRQMAKILAASLQRTFFTGDLLIVHNGDEPIFRVERKNVSEYFVDTPAAQGHSMKYKAREFIDASNYDWICFLDCDMIALRNIDHLFLPAQEADILWQPEPTPMSNGAFSSRFYPDEFPLLWRNGANSGTLAVRSQHYNQVMQEWESIDAGPLCGFNSTFDQPAWNRLLVSSDLKCTRFERSEICFPLLHDHRYLDYREAALLHANGGDTTTKLEFLMSQYLGRFIGEPAWPMLSILEP